MQHKVGAELVVRGRMLHQQEPLSARVAQLELTLLCHLPRLAHRALLDILLLQAQHLALSTVLLDNMQTKGCVPSVVLELTLLQQECLLARFALLDISLLLEARRAAPVDRDLTLLQEPRLAVLV